MSWLRINRERKSELMFVAALVGVLVLSLSFAEAILRSQGVLIADVANEDFDWCGFRQQTGVTTENVTTYMFESNTTFDNIHINALGFRGPELDQPKPKNRTRIAILGTSTILGPGLEERDTVPAQLVAQL